MTTTVFHCSDLHFGHPAVPAQYEAMEKLIHEFRYDVVAISGDVSQRTRSGEFQRARAFIKQAEETSKVICIPGNHDVAWWKSPLKLGNERAMFANYRQYISEDIEPVLRVPGVTFAGLNTSHGVTAQTLTWNIRDLSIIGIIRRAQIDRLRRVFAESPANDARVIVMHHNPVKGELSQRHGLKNTARALGAFADMSVDLVLCGHDHDEKVDQVSVGARKMVVACASTLTTRVRGGGPSSINFVEWDAATITVNDWEWSERVGTFARAKWARYTR